MRHREAKGAAALGVARKSDCRGFSEGEDEGGEGGKGEGKGGGEGEGRGARARGEGRGRALLACGLGRSLAGR